jgi:hypothetical protein
VVDIAVAVFRCDLRDPPHQATIGDLHGAAAAPAHEMMVVSGAAAAVQRLTWRRADHVHVTGPGQRVQGPVHGGQANLLAGLAELVMELLRGVEASRLIQQRDDR